MTDTPNKLELRRAAACFSDPVRREEYFDLYAPHVVLHRSPPLPPGLEAVKQFYRAYWAAFPDIRLSLGSMAEENDLLGCEFVVEGTHRGTFLGVPATNRVMRAAGVTLLRFESGRCVERWSQTDLLGILTQLGAAVRPPGDPPGAPA
ncbi:MAG: ester cyclase [Burkholderiales bacterium]|nr:ester cyclase [Burkholderiales bacterium]